MKFSYTEYHYNRDNELRITGAIVQLTILVPLLIWLIVIS